MSAPDLSDGQRLALIEDVFHSLEDGIVVLDREFNVLLTNKRMEQRYAARLPLVGEKCFAVMHDRIRACPECPYKKSLSTGQPHAQVMRDYCSRDLNGELGWCEVSSSLLRDSSGAVVGGIERVRDVTQIKRIEETLKDEVARRRLLVDQSRDGIVVLNHSGEVHEANQQFARMLGYTMDEVYQLHVWDWDAVSDHASLLQQIAAIDEQGRHFESRYRRKDGTFLEVELSTNGIYYGGDKLVFSVCRDITEKKAMQEKIRQLAIRDPLTEIYNRRYIFQRLGQVAAEYERHESDFCVSIMDLDHFKAVNDTYGHQAGDLALRGFAGLVASMIRPYDLLGRYGGEEFIIVSRNAAEAEVETMIRRIQAKVRTTAFTFQENKIRLTFSCGFAASTEYARETFSLEHLVSLADQRLYEAKTSGRDLCVGPDSLHSVVAEEAGVQAAQTPSPSN